jgi:Lar family restriction alleviation protein
MTHLHESFDPAVGGETLLPCPFCGGEAERFTIGGDEPNNVGGDVISCTKCGASSHVEFRYKENLVSHWNARATITKATGADQ